MPLTDNSQFALNLPIQVRIIPRLLHFKNPAGTSRGIYLPPPCLVRSLDLPSQPFPLRPWRMRPPSRPLRRIRRPLRDIPPCRQPPRRAEPPPRPRSAAQPSLRALRLRNRLPFRPRLLRGESHLTLLPTPFSLGQTGIPINGLVWMGTYEEMRCCRMQEKLREGFRCIKIKIGAIDFNEEIRLLRLLRQDFSPRRSPAPR